MADWIYFIHSPRENFASTMTPAEEEVWGRHFDRLKALHRDGVLVLAGPTVGTINTGVVIFEAPTEEAAAQIMAEDPVLLEGFARGELREFRVSLLKGQ